MRDGLSSNMVRSLHEDTDATLWVGTYGGGLNRLRNGRLTSYTTREGLFNDVVYQILEDSVGYLWMTCNLGVYRVFKRELEDFAEGRIKSIRSESFGKTDGMADAECNGGSPAGAVLADGTLWFPTSAGLAMVNPARLRRNDVPPPVFLEKVVSDDRQWTPKSALRLPSGTRRVEFHYTALSFSNPAKVRFAYRLEGFDDDWVSAGTERVAHYTHLSPGNYRFRVLASNDSGLWNRAGASVAVKLEPRYYQTPWFMVVCALGAAAGSFGLHRWRVARIRAYEQELERRVAEAVARVKRLHGLLPICSSCKKVRDDKGYWSALDQYVRERSEAEFSHGICPECLARLYPDFTDQPQPRTSEPN
jgi:hypothetical protein